MTVAYPLQWPAGFTRTRTPEKGRFTSTLPGALNNVQDELRKFGKDSGKPVTALVISSNYTLGDERPNDAGVAVYFSWDGLPVCIPIDRYSTIAANLQAVAHVVSARRTELRHGTLALVRATFTGFAALPGPSTVDWRKLLKVHGMDGTPSTILQMAEANYRQLAKSAHPDRGGSQAAMAELTSAIAAARRELNSGG